MNTDELKLDFIPEEGVELYCDQIASNITANLLFKNLILKQKSVLDIFLEDITLNTTVGFSVQENQNFTILVDALDI